MQRFSISRSVLMGISILILNGCGQGPTIRDAAKRAAPAGEMRPETPKAGELPNTENYEHLVESGYVRSAQEPRSTFSTSVDTASYSNIRRFLQNESKLPPKDAVRIADLLNYFDYQYPKPLGQDPVGISLEVAPCPWQPKHQLLKIALAAKVIPTAELPARNLVFLIDTSGSMDGPTRLGMVKESLKLLVKQLTERDHVGIVTYAGSAGVHLKPTRGDRHSIIERAIDDLKAGGSTNGSGGIVVAYEQAKEAFRDDGVNRVILATDGDFNVGISSEGDLIRLIEEKRKSGVYLTVLGYGMGNYQDSRLEKLAHHGNGHFAYIDSLDEARKVFVDQGGALAVVAKDVKLQVEFNHRQVQAYRLIGYENRILKNEDFRNDAKDAGEMGSGHTCTALYELVPNGVDLEKLPGLEKLKYQQPTGDTPAAKSDEWLTVRMRFKNPVTEEANEIERTVNQAGILQVGSSDHRFASAVAMFGMLLRESAFKGQASWNMVKEIANSGLDNDAKGYRREFVRLVEIAESLAGKK
jgi:Ca-activated chloride channel homolog